MLVFFYGCRGTLCSGPSSSDYSCVQPTLRLRDQVDHIFKKTCCKEWIQQMELLFQGLGYVSCGDLELDPLNVRVELVHIESKIENPADLGRFNAFWCSGHDQEERVASAGGILNPSSYHQRYVLPAADRKGYTLRILRQKRELRRILSGITALEVQVREHFPLQNAFPPSLRGRLAQQLPSRENHNAHAPTFCLRHTRGTWCTAADCARSGAKWFPVSLRKWMVLRYRYEEVICRTGMAMWELCDAYSNGWAWYGSSANVSHGRITKIDRAAELKFLSCDTAR